MINLLNREPLSVYDDDSDVTYEYSVVFKKKCDASYIYEFIRKRKSDVSDNISVLLIEIDDTKDLDTILSKPQTYWNYYEKIYHHMIPVVVYCKKDNNDDLICICHKENETVAKVSQFNKVIYVIDANDGPKYGFKDPQMAGNYSPIFVINIWKDPMSSINDHKPLLKSIIRQHIKEDSDVDG